MKIFEPQVHAGYEDKTCDHCQSVGHIKNFCKYWINLYGCHNCGGVDHPTGLCIWPSRRGLGVFYPNYGKQCQVIDGKTVDHPEYEKLLTFIRIYLY